MDTHVTLAAECQIGADDVAFEIVTNRTVVHIVVGHRDVQCLILEERLQTVGLDQLFQHVEDAAAGFDLERRERHVGEVVRLRIRQHVGDNLL